MKTRASFHPYAAAFVAVAFVVLLAPAVGAQYCASPGVTAPQCDGQCPLGQMCADSGAAAPA